MVSSFQVLCTFIFPMCPIYIVRPLNIYALRYVQVKVHYAERF